MSERRISRRNKSFPRGFVYVSRKRGGLACIIRDLSEKGARIVFSDTVMLPEMVDLYIPQREQMLRARVQWRRQDEIGLAFLEAAHAPDAAPTEAEVVQRIAQLEAKLASLRALLKRLKGEKRPAADDDAVA